MIVTSDVKDFASIPNFQVKIILLHDDTMPAYQITSALISLIETYPGPDAFPEKEILDDWA